MKITDSLDAVTISGKNDEIKNVCVYCSSSDWVSEIYKTSARELGEALGRNGYNVVYGGGNVGLMGIVADSAQEYGSSIIGVIPRKMVKVGLDKSDCEELILTDTMQERKKVMMDRADAFIAMPGGFGTLEEFFEILVLKQLHWHKKPIILYNINGYYNELLVFFEKIYSDYFAKPTVKTAFFVTDCLAALIDHLKNYVYTPMDGKWYERK